MISGLVYRTGPGLTVRGEAVFDRAGMYRYLLVRRWADGAPPVTFIMCNPSTADEDTDDPTIRRCIGFARREGAPALAVVNLFALRSTHPRQLPAAADPVGPHNDSFISEHARPGGLVIAAWGTWGQHQGRGAKVAAALAAAGVDLMCLGLTKDGQPRHPLYLPASASLIPFQPARPPRDAQDLLGSLTPPSELAAMADGHVPVGWAL